MHVSVGDRSLTMALERRPFSFRGQSGGGDKKQGKEKKKVNVLLLSVHMFGLLFLFMGTKRADLRSRRTTSSK